jgi:hypothetical protein
MPSSSLAKRMFESEGDISDTRKPSAASAFAHAAPYSIYLERPGPIPSRCCGTYRDVLPLVDSSVRHEWIASDI